VCVAFLDKGDNPLAQRKWMWLAHLRPPYLLKDMESRIKRNRPMKALWRRSGNAGYAAFAA
jgi:hypothetical protein